MPTNEEILKQLFEKEKNKTDKTEAIDPSLLGDASRRFENIIGYKKLNQARQQLEKTGGNQSTDEQIKTFLDALKMAESSGRRDVTHPVMQRGPDKGYRAFGEFALAPSTSKDMAKIAVSQGSTNEALKQLIKETDRNKINKILKENPEAEQEILKQLVKRVSAGPGKGQETNVPSEMAYRWSHGQNLSLKNVKKNLENPKKSKDLKTYLNNFERAYQKALEAKKTAAPQPEKQQEQTKEQIVRTPSSEVLPAGMVRKKGVPIEQTLSEAERAYAPAVEEAKQMKEAAEKVDLNKLVGSKNKERADAILDNLSAGISEKDPIYKSTIKSISDLESDIAKNKNALKDLYQGEYVKAVSKATKADEKLSDSEIIARLIIGIAPGLIGAAIAGPVAGAYASGVGVKALGEMDKEKRERLKLQREQGKEELKLLKEQYKEELDSLNKQQEKATSKKIDLGIDIAKQNLKNRYDASVERAKLESQQADRELKGQEIKQKGVQEASKELIDVMTKRGADAISKVKPDEIKYEISPGQQKLDQEFAKTYEGYVAQGGAGGIKKSLQLLDGAIQKLEKKDVETGPFVTLFKSERFATDRRALQQDVYLAIQNTLKATLGAQFAQKEADDLFKRTFDPTLPTEANVNKLKKTMQELITRAKSTELAAKYWETNNATLAGYKGLSNIALTVQGKDGMTPVAGPSVSTGETKLLWPTLSIEQKQAVSSKLTPGERATLKDPSVSADRKNQIVKSAMER